MDLVPKTRQTVSPARVWPALDMDTHDVNVERGLFDEPLSAVAALVLLGPVCHVHTPAVVGKGRFLTEGGGAVPAWPRRHTFRVWVGLSNVRF